MHGARFWRLPPDFVNVRLITIMFFLLRTGNERPAAVGWEMTPRSGKALPRRAELSDQLDPVRLADQACQLNLQLMRWRLVPDLDLSRVAACKCLLIGSGTLGCNVARGLLAWGVRHLTFIDNSSVSYSNPVRQSLFTLADIGKPKANCAAARLQEICPTVKAVGEQLSIAMPGHVVGDSSRDNVLSDVRRLHRLISDHDAIFLLTDTRESRWLPTVMAASLGKVILALATEAMATVIGDVHQQLRRSTKATNLFVNVLHDTMMRTACHQLGIGIRHTGRHASWNAN